MLTVAAWRLHVTVQGSTHLDLFDFIRSVVAGLLQNSRRPAVSGPSGRRIINNSIGQHYPINAERQGRCANCKKNTVKKCLEVMFACILCVSLTITNEEIITFSKVFTAVS